MGAAVLRQCLRRSHLLLLLRLLLEELVVCGEGVRVSIVVDDAVGECDLEVILGGCGAEVGLQEVLDVAVLFCGCGDGCSRARLRLLLLLLLRDERGVGGVGVVLGDGVVNCCRWGHWRRRGWVDEGEVTGEEVCEVIAGGVGPLLLAGLSLGWGRAGDEVCG